MLEVESIGSVRVIRMNNAAENRFNRPFVEAIHEVLAELEADGGTKSVIFTGAVEKYFSNGLDLAWILKQPHDTLADFLVSWNNLLHRVFTFPKPVVAAINGHAFAGGLFLALTTDWRVMREDRGWLCIPEIDLNLDLPPGNIALISHVLGTRNMERYGLTGERLTPEQALAAGMVDELASKDEVLPRATRAANLLGKKDPRQFARHKKNMRQHAARILAEEDPPYIRELLKTKKE